MLDLLPGKSFVEYLVAAGHDVFGIDWGTAGRRGPLPDFDDVAAAPSAARSGGPGGARRAAPCTSSATAWAGRWPPSTPRRAPSASPPWWLLAAPIDFDDGGLLSTWTRTPGFDVDALVDGCRQRAVAADAGQLPHAAPDAEPLEGGDSPVDRAWDDEFLDGFLALETWGNDNVSFPGECYRRYIEELYRDNALVTGGSP